MTAEENLKAIQSKLIDHATNIEDTLQSHGAKPWKVAVVVWNPELLDANIITMSSSISNEQLKQVVNHALK